jgi:uncharacterized protein (DUF2062 family)
VANTSVVNSLRTRWRSLRFRFLKRAHRPGRRSLWDFNRGSVSRGVAVGLFFGILTPVAQIVFATFVAVAVRGHLLTAAASTFITNPVTLPFVYYYAYRVGLLLTGRSADLDDDVAVSEAAAEEALDVTHWPTTLIEWASSIALPFLVGLVLSALVVATLGYVLVQAGWTVYEALRSRRSLGRDRAKP